MKSSFRATFKRAGVVAAAMLAVLLAPQGHAAGVSGQGTWETTLQGRDLDGNVANGFEAYYDTALKVTWLADANYAQTSAYSTSGFMNWDEANVWADQLVVGGVSGWRLPTLVDKALPGCNWDYAGSDCGFNVDTGKSEMAHLYYVTMGNVGFYDASGDPRSGFNWDLNNTGPFLNVQLHGYWSGVEVASDSGQAWTFGMHNGGQGTTGKADGFFAWAVHSGDVGQASAVPEPEALALAFAGLAVAAVAVRRRQR